ncbi:MAG: hypothetical protein HY648_04965 [Acidobacteria bacterium]|nr:hypothetical protein [Acidobacteriota bacterium]
MTPAFSVHTDPHFERLARPLRKQHRDFEGVLFRAVEILEIDPFNVTRSHRIKKLVDVPGGKGQYRIRLGRWRFRYDIYGREVVLTYCGLRREETYG